MLNPNEPVQMITSGEAVYIPMPVLVQTTRDVIRNPDIQRGAVFVGKNVHPIVVIAHASRNGQRCFASLNMTAG
jgi:hypothetical protein